MAPEIIAEKLRLLQEVLSDLQPHTRSRHDQQVAAHYEIERQVQLSVDLSVAIARRALSIQGKAVPPRARETFLDLGKSRMITKTLASRLAEAVGLRNLIVHEYGKLDYNRFFEGLPSGVSSLQKFSKAMALWLRKL